VRTSLDPTLKAPRDVDRELKVRRRIWAEWLDCGEPDVVETLRRHPELLAQRSLVLELALDEYESRREKQAVNLAEHCSRFREFGESLYYSVQRQLEVQRFLEETECNYNWPNPGEELGGFGVCEQLGTGAAARVYLCREREIGNRLVVVKVSRDTSFEASILGRLQHPHITPVHSTGFLSECGLHYLCMPYLGRSTLADVVTLAFQYGVPRRDDIVRDAAVSKSASFDNSRKGLFSWITRLRVGTYVDSILRLAIRIADALECAHAQQVLHGDLKPSNVLLTGNVEPILLDFNLSQDFARTGQLCGGTLPYMPPEHLQLLGKSKEPESPLPFTPATDVYSFGALLYELLTGLPPVTDINLLGDVAETAAAICERLDRGIREVRSFNPYVSRSLSGLIARCLAVEPKDRPATMGEVRRQLRLERCGWSAIMRHLRVRPFLYSVVLGLPITVASAGSWYKATLPPKYLRDYQEGLKLGAANHLPEAITFYASAASANPTYLPARFELARARMRLGDYNLAASEFGYLDRHEGHLPSLVYLAYCYNLQQVPTAAIPLYERAIHEGIHSAAVHNNLAASYLDGSSNLSPSQRLLRSETHLDRACMLAPELTAIHLNYVRLATKKSERDAGFDPSVVWPHARRVLQVAPSDELTRHAISSWWSCVLNYEQHHPETRDASFLKSAPVSSERATARRKLAAVYELEHAKSNVAAPRSPMNSPLHLTRYYLEPDIGSDISSR
jgi:serine/threonine protein kinase/tetratricopeptide (TPR) repeat protein